jgi:hypothetical protein
VELKQESKQETKLLGPLLLAAIERMRARYFELYTAEGATRFVAQELWDRFVDWVKTGKSEMPKSLRRRELRLLMTTKYKLVTSKDAIAKALQTLAQNLSIFGYARGLFYDGSSLIRPFDPVMPNLAESFCTIGETSWLLKLLGPTGNDRGDRTRDALYLILHPTLVSLPTPQGVLRDRVRPPVEMSRLRKLEVSFSAPRERRKAAAAIDELLQFALAAAVAMHGAKGVFQKRRGGKFEADFVTNGCGCWTEAEVVKTVPDAVALLLSIEYRYPFRTYDLGKVVAGIPSSILDGIALSYQSLNAIDTIEKFKESAEYRLERKLRDRFGAATALPERGWVIELTSGVTLGVRVSVVPGLSRWFISFERRARSVVLSPVVTNFDLPAFLDWLVTSDQ